MLDSVLMDKLDEIARKCRPSKGQQAFGGIKLVLSGDFCQLPPVGLGDFGKKFAFDSESWKAASWRRWS